VPPVLIAVSADMHANRHALAACLAQAPRSRNKGLPTWLADRLAMGR